MKRRDFLKTSGGASLTGAWGATRFGPTAQAAAASATFSTAPAVLSTYTAEDHRQRLQNIARCQQGIRSSLRKHLITSYLPGQACYNLGEYPCRKPWDPDETDEQELDKLRDHGIQLIQVFDEWNDSLRLFGGDKYTALNPAGSRRFVEMVHQRGMKLLAYVSTGFIEQTDPDFRQEWSRKGDSLHVGYWNMARCSPSSAGWRAYLLPRIVGVLNDNAVDGLYIDCGYVTNSYNKPAPTKDEVLAFEETPTHDGALADLLALIYAEVKRRGGIVKLHVSGAAEPRVGDLHVYDYLWVGEGVQNADVLREKVKHHMPYVVPCIDREFAPITNEDEPYLHGIPYMQFPILQAGRPFTGERARIPGIKYPPEEKDFWVRRCREIWKVYQAHPDGPYTYSIWDAVPGQPEIRPTHARWLRRYAPLVEEGTWAWLELGDSDLFSEPLHKEVVASAFANRQLHLVLANYGQSAVQLQTTDAYVPVDDLSATAARHWSLDGRSLRILRRST
ncbi:MAG: hypothetical protein ACC628_22285 [Pirellulaceae bacterium]